MALKLRAKAQFPLNVLGSNGIGIVKSDGVWTFKVDYSALADAVPDTADFSNDKVLYFNSVTGIAAVVNLTELLQSSRSMRSPRIVTGGGAVAVGVSDEVIVMNLGAPSATTFNLPAVAARVPKGLSLRVFDWAGNAGDMTFVPNGTEQIMGANANWVVSSGGVAQTGGTIELIPSTDLNGWLVK